MFGRRGAMGVEVQVSKNANPRNFTPPYLCLLEGRLLATLAQASWKEEIEVSTM